MGKITVGVSGASGVILADLAIRALVQLGYDVDFVVSKSAIQTVVYELGEAYATPTKWVQTLPKEIQEHVSLHQSSNFCARIASGTYNSDGMLLIPCSMASLGAIASGIPDTLVRRAADVTIKEGRPLVLVPRETPFNAIHLENMTKLAKIGVTILPPVPAWYLKPKTIEDINDFIIARALDALKIAHHLHPRWGDDLS